MDILVNIIFLCKRINLKNYLTLRAQKLSDKVGRFSNHVLKENKAPRKTKIHA